jgi:hypothetical protein
MSDVRVTTEVYVASPGPGTAVLGAAYYTSLQNDSLVGMHYYETKSDIWDILHIRHSADAGQTWSTATEWRTVEPRSDGIHRRYLRDVYVDPPSGRCIFAINQGIFPTGDPLEGMRHWALRYQVRDAAGRQVLFDEPIVHQGHEYDPEHPLPGVTIGRNCVMIGDRGQRPVTRPDGVILWPVVSSPVGPDGDYHNPGSGYTYLDCMVLFGRWRPDGGLSWTCSERIVGDPQRTTRGLDEPAIALLDDGSVLMLMRGSNDANLSLPGYRWASWSRDGGETWDKPVPWTYADGEAFHSPSSCSQLLQHSSGRLLWLGNLCATNAKGNGPRYPLAMGEVDRRTGLLQRETVAAMDDRRAGESPYLTLSNFYAREERTTGDILLYMTRLFAQDFRLGGQPEWTADALVYRLTLGSGAKP